MPFRITIGTQNEAIPLVNFQPFEDNSLHADILFGFNTAHNLTDPLEGSCSVLEYENLYSEIYASDSGYSIVSSIRDQKRRLDANADGSVFNTDLDFTGRYDDIFANQFLMTAFGMASMPFRTLKIHASVIEKDGRALVFLGKSGTGKSTHSRLWLENVPGASLVNDDEPIVRIMETGEVRVFGSPWSGKTPCYRNVSATVSAFVHLYQHDENELEKLEGIEAFSALFTSTLVFKHINKSREFAFETVSDILQSVPVYKLKCRADREAVSLTENLL